MALDLDLSRSATARSARAAREPNSAQTQILYAVYLCSLGKTAEGRRAATAMTVDPRIRSAPVARTVFY
jgi:hypothetical protein